MIKKYFFPFLLRTAVAILLIIVPVVTFFQARVVTGKVTDSTGAGVGKSIPLFWPLNMSVLINNSKLKQTEGY